MKFITIKNKQYCAYEDLKKSNHLSTVRCTQTQQKYIDKNGLIADQDYIYVRLVDGKLIDMTDQTRSKKYDKLYVAKEWIECFDNPDKKRNVTEAPPIVDISDAEWCKDNTGKVYEIEIRGERTIKGSYFRALDVGSAFGIDRYNETISRKDSGYVEGEDYVFFEVSRPNGTTKRIKREVFLTMNGLIVGVTRARKNSAGAYLFKWIVNVFFNGLLGTPEQKDKAVKKILGKSYTDVKQNLNCVTGPIAAIYLIRLGTVEECREAFNITGHKSSHGVYKAGKAGDFIERLQQHVRGYNKREISNILVHTVHTVDYALLPEAEESVFEYFGNKNMRLESSIDKEIVIIPDEKLSKVKSALRKRLDRYVPAKNNTTWVIESLRKDIENQKIKQELEVTKVHLSYQSELTELKCEISRLKAENAMLKS